jgi:predicted dehydrogenase
MPRHDDPMAPVKIGTLGAARITPSALIKPAQKVPEVVIAAVAARDPERARAFAAKHGIPTVHSSYEDLVNDAELDAVYVPLPNGLHAEWTLKALDAGKHVLCEKPFTSNADEAQHVADVAAKSGRVVMEAFHYRYHPMAERMKDIVNSGVLGQVRHIETALCIPLPMKNDIRYRFELAGGATMDVGCYAIHQLRLLAGAEPDVIAASAKLARPYVDRWMQADFRFHDGRTGRMTCALWSARLFNLSARVSGTDGELRAFNLTGPQFYNRLKVTAKSRTSRERVRGDASYVYQLRAFAAAVPEGAPVLTGPADAVANMRVIDEVYRAAGLPVRGTAVGG